MTETIFQDIGFDTLPKVSSLKIPNFYLNQFKLVSIPNINKTISEEVKIQSEEISGGNYFVKYGMILLVIVSSVAIGFVLYNKLKNTENN